MSLAPHAAAFHQVPIELGDRSYPIKIGGGLLGDPATWSEVPPADQALSKFVMSASNKKV